jgi:hypothetical protein
MTCACQQTIKKRPQDEGVEVSRKEIILLKPLALLHDE